MDKQTVVWDDNKQTTVSSNVLPLHNVDCRPFSFHLSVTVFLLPATQPLSPYHMFSIFGTSFTKVSISHKGPGYAVIITLNLSGLK